MYDRDSDEFRLFFCFKHKTEYEMRIIDWSSDVCSSDLLRVAGVSVIVHAGSSGFKAQFKRADASGARVAVILGSDEVAAGTASVKCLRTDAAGEAAQQQVALDRQIGRAHV